MARLSFLINLSVLEANDDAARGVHRHDKTRLPPLVPLLQSMAEMSHGVSASDMALTINTIPWSSCSATFVR
jgi:hypothetical protein